jgi:hypothetical protein
MARFVLALQFWEGDKATAMRNARRIADNELTRREDVEFVFVPRFDVDVDISTVRYVAQKFKTSVHQGRRRGKGWPHGCNELWCDFMQESVRRVRDGEWADVNGVFTFEADCVPIHSDWINVLKKRWEEVLAAGKLVMGHKFDDPPPHGHINGNAIFHPLVAQQLDLIGCTSEAGWDWVLSKKIMPFAVQTGFIKTIYNSRNVQPEWMESSVFPDEKPVVIHGGKDLSVEEYADRRLNPGKTRAADTLK